MSNKEEIVEETDKKSIIVILIAIVVVLGLILLTLFMNDEKEILENNGNSSGDNTVQKTDDQHKDEDLSESKTTTNVQTVSNKKYTVRYLDIDGNQLGKTQMLNSLEDRVNEKAPKIDGMRFIEWLQSYSEYEDIYYFIATYKANVEVTPNEEERHIKYKDKEPSYTATVTVVNNEETTDEEDELEEDAVENPTFEVSIEGDIPLVGEVDEEVTIDEDYEHIMSLRFNAPEDVTKEDIENMSISVHSTDPNEVLDENQYSYNGEDTSKKGRELLDSTDEEYENNIFYFYYYQETETRTDSTVEVYWGNDPNVTEETDPPSNEYVEVYNITFTDIHNENEIEMEEISEEINNEQVLE